MKRTSQLRLARFVTTTYRSARCVFVCLAVLMVGIADEASAMTPQSNVAPPRASQKARLLLTIGHSARVNSAVFSPDGKRIVTTSDDNSARLWDVATGAELRRFIGHTYFVVSATFSRDGTRILTTSWDNTARLWDVASGKELFQFKLHSAISGFATLSPDGKKLLTAASDSVPKLWDSLSGQELTQFLGHAKTVGSGMFSTDGNRVFTASQDGSARMWDTDSGQMIRQFDGHPSGVHKVLPSPDGKRCLTVGYDRLAVLWDVDTGKELRRFSGPSNEVVSAAFSSNGSRLLITSPDEQARIWDVGTGRMLIRLPGRQDGVSWATFSPSDAHVLTVGSEGITWLLDAGTGKDIREMDRYSEEVDRLPHATFSADGLFLATAGIGESARLLEVASGNEIRKFTGRSKPVWSADFSNDGARLVTTSSDMLATVWELRGANEVSRLVASRSNERVWGVSSSPDIRVLTGDGQAVRVWDVAAGKEIAQLDHQGATVTFAEFSPNGSRVVTVSSDRWVRLWDVAAGIILGSYPGGEPRSSLLTGLEQDVLEASVSPDGSRLIVSNATAPARILDTANGTEIGRLADSSRLAQHVTFSPDGSLVFASHLDGTARLWDVVTGAEIRLFKADSKVVPSFMTSAIFSLDGSRVLTASIDGTARLWDVTSGNEIRTFSGHFDSVSSAALSRDGRFVVTTSADGTTRLWKTSSGEELCALISLADDGFVVIDPQGRFDTNNPEGIDGIFYEMPNEPLRPLPVEVFFRQYYEPRLLERILGGESLPDVPDLSTLDRVQPVVKILDVSPEKAVPDRVTVRVAVSPGQSGDASTGPQPSIFDLRLFRDGQLVGYAPRAGGELEVDAATGKVIVSFEHIQLPHSSPDRNVHFSAYAFNRSLVRSAIDRTVLSLRTQGPARKGRAYVISVGVNATENADWSLRFPAGDAQSFATEVSAAISVSGRYSEVVPLILVSDDSATTATKSNIRAVFDLLSGEKVDPVQVAAITNADRLRAATPDDLILVSFSCHGYKAREGEFYLVPYDVGGDATVGGDGTIPAMVLERLISSEDLSLWLRNVDAGEIGMAIDACHSGAFAGEAFKPGPMGARGLGQLAYDKGMRILAATQGDDVATGRGLLKSGLLAYALRVDGLKKGRADGKPPDGQLGLVEWFTYAAKRVPVLYRLTAEAASAGVLPDELRPLVEVRPQEVRQGATAAGDRVQTPALFDFVRTRPDVVFGRIP